MIWRNVEAAIENFTKLDSIIYESLEVKLLFAGMEPKLSENPDSHD